MHRHATSQPEAEGQETPATPLQPGDEQPGALEEGQDPQTLPMQLGVLLRPTSWSALMLTGLLMLAVIYTLYVARLALIPIVLALLLDFLLGPLIRWLYRCGLPRPVSSAALLALVTGLVLVGIYNLSGPAIEFTSAAPDQLRRLEYRLQGFSPPVQEAAEDAASQAADEVEAATRGPGLVDTSFRYGSTFGFAVLITFILALFLLSMGDTFLNKLVRVLPTIHDKRLAVEVVRQIEQDISTYLLTVTTINICLGAASAVVFWLIGLPSPIMWGVAVAALNYMPYLGPTIVICLLAIAGLIGFDSLPEALLPPLAFFCLNLAEAYIITPYLLGRRLNLNPPAILLSLVFWGFLWGIPGALLSVPLLMTVKIICDRIDSLRAIGEFLVGTRN